MLFLFKDNEAAADKELDAKTYAGTYTTIGQKKVKKTKEYKESIKMEAAPLSLCFFFFSYRLCLIAFLSFGPLPSAC